MPVLHGPPAKVKVVHLLRCYTHTHAFIQRSFYSQTVLQPLHKEAFTAKIFLQGSSYKQQLFIHRSFYSEKPVNRAALHTEAFIHTQKKEQPFHRAAFTHWSLCLFARTSLCAKELCTRAEELCTTGFTHSSFHTEAYTRTSFYIQKILRADAFTQRSFDIKKILHREAFTKACARRGFHTHTLLHTEAFTQSILYTEKHLRTGAFAHRRLYTKKLLHIDAFTHRIFFTEKRLHRAACTHRSFTQRGLYTEQLLHTDTSTHRGFCTETYTQRSFYTGKPLHREAFTHKLAYTQRLLHREAFPPSSFYTRQFYRSFWCSAIILCERLRLAFEIAMCRQFRTLDQHFARRVASAVGKSQAISRETVASGGSKSQFNPRLSIWAWC